MKKLRATVAILAFTLTLLPVQTWAEVIATRTRVGALVFADGAAHLIPLNDAGSTNMPFVTTRDFQRVVISFNAECSVKGTDNITWLNLDILVDGVAAAPSSNDNAFCTDRGNNLLANWTSVVTTAVFVVQEPGIHTVQVRGTLVTFNAGDQWRVDDESTIIMQ